MQFTLTLADVVLALLIAIIGALIAAYLWSRLPRWGSQALTLWAERSEKATRKRVEALKQELQLINDFKTNPTRYIEWIVENAAVMVGYLALMIVALAAVGMAAWRRVLDIITLQFHTSYTGPIDQQVLRISGLVFIAGAGVVGVALLMRSARLLRYSDLDRLRAFVEEQIARLKKSR